MKKTDFTNYTANKSIPDIKAKTFVQDPSIADTNANLRFKTLTIKGESCVGPGPTSSRVAVVDYNADLDVIFEPVRVKADGKGFAIGGKKPIDNLKFHQVNVWAIICNTLELLENERLFGRRIPWAFNRGRLLVLPHAGYWENAFYDRSTGALHFFYFETQDGKPVYTCLSHDIVTHELGHAVLDGLKPYYNEITSPATAGFHEYFGDAIALTAGLSQKELVVEVVGRNSGDISGSNVLANIASEFGQALAPERYGSLSDAYLRSGLNSVVMSDLEGVYEPHDYSEVLTGLYWDMLSASYEHLLTNARYAGPTNRKKPNVRVKALISAGRVVSRLMMRALDYCPPVDIRYQDYAQAIWRADFVTYPHDPYGFREILIEALGKRGIISTGKDKKKDIRRKFRIYNDQLRYLDIDAIGASNTEAYKFLDANRSALHIPQNANLEIIRLYRTCKVAADGFRPPRELIVEFVWPELVRLKGARFGGLSGSNGTLWCGGTLVFSSNGNLLQFVLKENTPQRRTEFVDYISYLTRTRQISVDDGEVGLGARGSGASSVTAKIVNGEVRMQRTAAFRHMTSGGVG